MEAEARGATVRLESLPTGLHERLSAYGSWHRGVDSGVSAVGAQHAEDKQNVPAAGPDRPGLQRAGQTMELSEPSPVGRPRSRHRLGGKAGHQGAAPPGRYSSVQRAPPLHRRAGVPLLEDGIRESRNHSMNRLELTP